MSAEKKKINDNLPKDMRIEIETKKLESIRIWILFIICFKIIY